MNVVMKNVDELIPYENNPRINDHAVEYVINSIKEFGFKVPIVVDRHNVIVTGHTRLKAAKELEMEQVPVLVADDLSEEQIQAFRLADNKVSEIAEWDEDALAVELEELSNLNFDMSKFDFKDLEEITEKENEDTSPTELTEDTVIVVETESEAELEEVFGQLIEEGYNCRLLTL